MHTVEKLSNRAHGEEDQVAISAIFRNSRKGQSIDEEFNATGREMELGEIVTGAGRLAGSKIIPREYYQPFENKATPSNPVETSSLFVCVHVM